MVPSPEDAEIAVAMEEASDAKEVSADEAPAKELAPDAMEPKLDASITWPVKVVLVISYIVSQESVRCNHLLVLFNIPITKLTHAQRMSVQPENIALIILCELFYAYSIRGRYFEQEG